MREIAIRGFINEKYNTPFGKGLFRRAIYNGSVELKNPTIKYLVDFYEYDQFQHTAKTDEQINVLKKFDACGVATTPDLVMSWIVYYEPLSQRLDISQNMKTGEVQLTKFHRGRKILDLDWVEIINDVSYYPYYQEMPIAAYLIPKNLPNESEVFIPDPIEDFKLTNFPLSDNRANNLIGVVLNKKVILKPHQTKIIEWVG